MRDDKKEGKQTQGQATPSWNLSRTGLLEAEPHPTGETSFQVWGNEDSVMRGPALGEIRTGWHQIDIGTRSISQGLKARAGPCGEMSREERKYRMSRTVGKDLRCGPVKLSNQDPQGLKSRAVPCGDMSRIERKDHMRRTWEKDPRYGLVNQDRQSGLVLGMGGWRDHPDVMLWGSTLRPNNRKTTVYHRRRGDPQDRKGWRGLTGPRSATETLDNVT